MTPLIWAGLAVVVVAAVALVFRRLAPEHRLAAGVLAAALGLGIARMFPLAVPVALFGMELLRRARPAAGPTPSPGGRSSIESPGLAMTLDHGTGTLDGAVRTGPFTGRRLSTLSSAELQALMDEFAAAGDEESLALLLGYLDRLGSRPATPPPAQGPMSRSEAYRVLGLSPGASLDEVRAAYRRLIRRVHPDLGGSTALAALLNEAKELLDPS